MTTERRHRCGGKLQPREVQIRDEGFAYRVAGLVCDACGEELIDRETAVTLERSATPTVSWDQQTVSSRLSGSQFILTARAQAAA